MEGEPAPKKRRGSGGRVPLTPRSKRQSVLAAQRKYNQTRPKAADIVKLSLSVSRRWKLLSEEAGMDTNDFAVMLLDLFESKSTIVQSPPASFQPLAMSTPAVLTSSAMRSSATDVSSQMDVLGEEKSSSNGSDISGVLPLQTLSSPSTRQASSYMYDDDQPGCSKDSQCMPEDQHSDEELDISVDYKLVGEYVYLHGDLKDEAVDLDDTWEPVVSMTNRKSCVGLEYVSASEEVHGRGEEQQHIPVEDDQASFSRSGLHRVLKSPDGAEKTRLFIITETRLKDLATEARRFCNVCGGEMVSVDITPSGTSAHISWTCGSGHSSVFCCQETLHRTHLGDLQLASALFLSGNNYSKVALMFNFMNMRIINPNVFNACQRKFICPAVEETAAEMMEEVRRKHAGKELVLLGDGRNDSPGHCAQYLTYTLMENVSKDIIHAEFMDKRETGRVSGRMEPRALEKGMQFLSSHGVKIKELVTDAHATISSTMRKNYKHIKHSYDVWHGAKNLGKKLAKASTTAKNKPLQKWQSDVTTHFWYCSRTCNGSAKVFKAKWRGLLHHVTGVHEWKLGGGVGIVRCDHEPLDPRDDYLESGTPPHDALKTIVMDKQLLANIPYYINFRHTGEIESLHSHILMYASKRFSFGYHAYRARNLLAMIDYQQHKDRPVKKDADGKDKYVAKWSKRAGDYVPIKEREAKQYAYIPGMMAAILKMRFEDMEPLKVLPVMRADDPRRIAPRLAPKSPPNIEDLLKKRHILR